MDLKPPNIWSNLKEIIGNSGKVRVKYVREKMMEVGDLRGVRVPGFQKGRKRLPNGLQ